MLSRERFEAVRRRPGPHEIDRGATTDLTETGWKVARITTNHLAALTDDDAIDVLFLPPDDQTAGITRPT